MNITKDDAEQFIDAYCYDAPLPDAADRLAAIDTSFLYGRTGNSWIHIVGGLGLDQDELDDILYGAEAK